MILSVSSSAALRPISGFAPAPRPLVSLLPNWNLHRRLRRFQRLQVGVRRDKLHALDLGADHAVDGVAAAAAHANHLDLRALMGVLAE